MQVQIQVSCGENNIEVSVSLRSFPWLSSYSILIFFAYHFMLVFFQTAGYTMKNTVLNFA